MLNWDRWGKIVSFYFFRRKQYGRADRQSLITEDFSITIEKLIAGKDRTMEWKLPLTSISTPKHCPVGKESVQANWKYCRWNGVKLGEVVAETSPK